ncbi:hypothetical protein MYIN104542_30200 [Mycobacterium intermedium]
MGAYPQTPTHPDTRKAIDCAMAPVEILGRQGGCELGEDVLQPTAVTVPASFDLFVAEAATRVILEVPVDLTVKRFRAECHCSPIQHCRDPDKENICERVGSTHHLSGKRSSGYVVLRKDVTIYQQGEQSSVVSRLDTGLLLDGIHLAKMFSRDPVVKQPWREHRTNVRVCL